METRKASSDGTNHGLGTPLFSYQPFHDEKVIGHAPGAGTASLNNGYGSTHRSIESGAPFWKGTGGGGSRRSAGHARESREQETTRV